MRRVGKGTRIAEYAFIPRFSEKTFQRFGNNRGWAGRDCAPRFQRRSRWSMVDSAGGGWRPVGWRGASTTTSARDCCLE